MDNTSNYQSLPTIPGQPAPHNAVAPASLLKALYWIWDAFGRANMPMFLVKQTYKDAWDDTDLTGDKVEIGVSRMEWTSGSKRILDNFLGKPVSESADVAEYRYEGVPVFVHVYDPIPCIQQLDSIVYRYEDWLVPNTYKDFEEVYG